MKLLENIHGTQLMVEFYEWLQGLEFDKTLKSSYAPERLERWFMMGSNLQSIDNGRGEIIYYPDPPEFVTELGKKHMPDFNSILVCKGHKPLSDSTIDWHRDHGHFFGPSVMLNVGRAEYSQQDYKEGLQTMTLENGDVVWIDTKLVHRSLQRSKLRYNVTFRRVKPEYASKPLF